MNRDFSNLLLAVLLALFLNGCGTTRVDERRTYMAEKGSEVSFFRVTLHGYADMSEVKYDAGWKKAQAVDEIVQDEPAPLGDIEQKQNELIQYNQMVMLTNVLSKLTNAMDVARPDSEEIKAIENRLVQTLSLQRRLRARETSQVPEAPAQKYVIVFAANPDKVMNEIGSVVDRQEQEGALLSGLAAFSKGPKATAVLQENLILQRWQDLDEELKGELKLPDYTALLASADGGKRDPASNAAPATAVSTNGPALNGTNSAVQTNPPTAFQRQQKVQARKVSPSEITNGDIQKSNKVETLGTNGVVAVAAAATSTNTVPAKKLNADDAGGADAGNKNASPASAVANASKLLEIYHQRLQDIIQIAK